MFGHDHVDKSRKIMAINLYVYVIYYNLFKYYSSLSLSFFFFLLYLEEYITRENIKDEYLLSFSSSVIGLSYLLFYTTIL